ncbi:hypothetical protein D918_09378 [Trichuris suis]|nr:hypothetical protein D918_09378 [Trichuris suis]
MATPEQLAILLETQEHLQQQLMELQVTQQDSAKTQHWMERLIPSIDSISNSISEFTYDAENGLTFESWFKRYEDVFKVDAASLPDDARVRLLLRKLPAALHDKYAKYVLPKHPRGFTFKETVDTLTKVFAPQSSLFNVRYQCLRLTKNPIDDIIVYTGLVNQHCERFRLKELSEEQFRCLIFVRGLQSPSDADFRIRLLQMIECDPKLNVHDLAEEYQRLKSLKHDAGLVENNAQRRKGRARPSGVFSTSAANPNLRKYVTPLVNGYPVRLQLDSGSDFTLVSHRTWEVMGRPVLLETSMEMVDASTHVMQLAGYFECQMSLNNRYGRGRCFVTTQGTLNLLGLDWIEKLQLWNMSSCGAALHGNLGLEHEPKNLKVDIHSLYPKVYNAELGHCTRFKASLNLRPDAQPIFKRNRPVPYATRTLVEQELDRLEQLDFNRPFILDTDASNIAIGAVLPQLDDKGREHPVAFASRTLTRAEQRYCVTRREMLAVVTFVERFRPYLQCKFVPRTDHGSLRWLQSFKNPDGQWAR